MHLQYRRCGKVRMKKILVVEDVEFNRSKPLDENLLFAILARFLGPV